MSGKEHWALQTVHLSVVANLSVKYSRELTIATRALLNTLYWAQLPSHTTRTLKAFKKSYSELQEYRHVWIKNGSRQGEKGNTIPHFNIPKFHTILHLLEQILSKGTADNYSTKPIEHMHMDTLKDAFPATNKKDWEKQTIRWKRIGSEASSQVGNPIQRAVVNNLDEPRPLPTALSRDAPGNGNALPHQRGGYALQAPSLATNHPLVPSKLPSLAIPQKTQKRKRQINEEDMSEKRTAKRILQSQQDHGLQDFQDISLVPSDTLTMAQVQDTYGLPNLLTDYKAGGHPFSEVINRQSEVQVWKSIRLLDPQRRFFPEESWRRAQALATTEKEPAVADPVLYIKDGLGSSTRAQASFRLKGKSMHKY